MTSGRPPRGRPRAKGFDDVPELSNEEVERRVDVRGGGTPRGPVERPVRAGRSPRPPERTVARDSILLVGLVIVGLVAVRLLLPDGPLTGSPTQSPGGTLVVIGPVAPGTATPAAPTPWLQTLTPVVTPDPGSPVPTVAATTANPGPTPTLKPGETPKPTPKPTPTLKPTPTAGPTPVGTTQLTVIVQLQKDDGGTALAGSWTIAVDSDGSASPSSFAGSSTGTIVTISAGQPYQVTDSGGPSGYASTPSTGCSSATSGLPVAGVARSCTILKNDIKPRVTVYTIVNGGSQSPADWTVNVTGTDVTPNSSFAGSAAGVQVLVDANAAFSIDQSNPSDADYTEDVGSNCSGSLAPGAAVSCTFTYTYDPPPTEPPPPSEAPSAPLAWLVLVAGAPGIRGRRWWTTFRTR